MVLLFFLSLMITASQCKVEIVQQPQNQTTCFGSIVQFNCSLNGTNVLPSWIINGSFYSPLNLPLNTYANAEGLMVIAENHNVSYQCYFIDILESGAEQTVISDVAYLLLNNADCGTHYQTQQFIFEDPPITALYVVSNRFLYLHWRKPNVSLIASYNIFFNFTVNNAIVMKNFSVDGNTLRKTWHLPSTACTTENIFKLRIQACSNESCSLKKANCSNYVVDLNDPGLLQFQNLNFASSDMEVCINMDNYSIDSYSWGEVMINNMVFTRPPENNSNNCSTDPCRYFLNVSFVEYRYYGSIGLGQLCINVTELLMEFPNEIHFSVCAVRCHKYDGSRKRFQANLTKLPETSTSISAFSMTSPTIISTYSMTSPTITAESIIPVCAESSHITSPTITAESMIPAITESLFPSHITSPTRSITAESMTLVITESSNMPSPATTGSGWNLKADITVNIIGLFALYSLHTVYSSL